MITDTRSLTQHSSWEAGEQSGAIRRGVGGAKGGDQGECEPPAGGCRSPVSSSDTSGRAVSKAPKQTCHKSQYRAASMYSKPRSAIAEQKSQLGRCRFGPAKYSIGDGIPSNGPQWIGVSQSTSHAQVKNCQDDTSV